MVAPEQRIDSEGGGDDVYKEVTDARPRVAVIGAGLGGIAVAYNLKRAGLTSYTVLEQSAGPGGTWWDNTYPGCAVDLPSFQFSFSFFKNYAWSGNYATQPELQKYCEEALDRFGLRSHFRFNTRVDRVAWDDAAKLYRVRLANGEEADYELVVTCVGLLSNPKFPDWPGLEDFEGSKFHTSRWQHDVDLAGKTVAVVGTGSSAAQVVPAIAPIVDQLYVFQRQAGWVLPKEARKYSQEDLDRYANPMWITVDRMKAHRKTGALMGASNMSNKHHETFSKVGMEYLDSVIEDRQLREAVRPVHPLLCKRPVIDDDFYPALTRDNVELVPRAVTRVTPTGVVDADGVERKIDVLILASGFQTTNYLGTLEVLGPGGRRIQDIWGDSEAFLGVSVAGMPNFFMIYGPNSNGGSVIAVLERQAEVVARMARRLRGKNGRVIDTRRSVQDRYVRWIDGQNKKRSAEWAGCNNYFFAASGRNVTQMQMTPFRIWLLMRTLPSIGMALRRVPARLSSNEMITNG